MGADEYEDPFGPPPPDPALRHEIGQPLDRLSLHELVERIALLQAEIKRVEAALLIKHGSQRDADAVFKR